MKRAIVDGNNCLWAFARIRRLVMRRKWEEGCTRLVGIVARAAEKKDLRATVVFDLSGLKRRPKETAHGVEVVWSEPGEEADRVIHDYLEAAESPAEWVVVSSDKQVRAHARKLGARVSGPREFFG